MQRLMMIAPDCTFSATKNMSKYVANFLYIYLSFFSVSYFLSLLGGDCLQKYLNENEAVMN